MGKDVAMQPERQVFAIMDETGVQYPKEHGSDYTSI